MKDRTLFLINRIREKLWVRPLIFCLLSIAGAFGAQISDQADLANVTPELSPDSIRTLLSIMSASMLVIATFSVGSMVAAYASASSGATPRAFSLVLVDDVSQNALSTFIGAFIFSIVGLIALENSYYDVAGRFTLFCLTIAVFVLVIVTFVTWVDRIARLGRLGSTIENVEVATTEAIKRRIEAPTLGGVAVTTHPDMARSIVSQTIEYVQRIDLHHLQGIAEANGLRIEIAALPGTFASPDRKIAYVWTDSGEEVSDDIANEVVKGFHMGGNRTFDEDPRFGLVVMAEIASRALSPGINDPGTAIDVIGRTLRILAVLGEGSSRETQPDLHYDRVAVPEIVINDLFEDTYNAIGRDGAGCVEVVVRLQKALGSLSSLADPVMRAAALNQSRRALMRAETALNHPDDLQAARDAATFAYAESPAQTTV